MKRNEMIKVVNAEPLPDGYTLRIHFSDGAVKLFDFTPYLDIEPFRPLKDRSVFLTARPKYGTVMWLDGEIDFAPETLYVKGSVTM